MKPAKYPAFLFSLADDLQRECPDDSLTHRDAQKLYEIGRWIQRQTVGAPGMTLDKFKEPKTLEGNEYD